MTDRELLELAAKAAGIEWCPVERLPPDDGYWKFPDGKTQAWWNPLTDDGDALRLAVKLGLRIECNSKVLGDTLVSTPTTDVLEIHNGDPYAATRRAIVKAAAEIGRNMK